MTTITSDDGALTKRARGDLTTWTIILAFFVAITLPALLQCAGLTSAFMDNRSPAPPPRFPTSLADLMALPKTTEAYLNDHFGLRSELVRLNSLARLDLGVSTSPNVAVGRHNFLFYAYEPERLMEQHTGEDVFTEQSLGQWVNGVANDAAWLAQRGIAFYVVVAPDKSTIYPEDLPDYPRLPNSTTRLDQIVDAIKGRKDIVLIDPRAAIMAQKPAHRMYPIADTHWSQRAAYVAYSMLMDRIEQRFPNARRVPFSDYTASILPTRGDLANTLNLYDILQYDEEQLSYRPRSHVLDTQHLAPEQPWGWPVTQVHTDLKDRPRILIQGDSFTDYVMGPTFLYQTFRDPTYMHHNGLTLNTKVIERLHPDIVVLELAERYLSIL